MTRPTPLPATSADAMPCNSNFVRILVCSLALTLGCSGSPPSKSSPTGTGNTAASPLEEPAGGTGSAPTTGADVDSERQRASQETLDGDLRLVPAAVLATAVFRPAEAAEKIGGADLPGAHLLGELPLPLKDIRRAVLVLLPDSTDAILDYGWIIEFDAAVDRAQIVSWLSPGAESLAQDKRIHYCNNPPVEQWTLAFPSDTVVAAGRMGFAQAVLARADGAAGAAHFEDGYRAGGAAGQVVVHVDLDQLGHFISIHDQPSAAYQLVDQIAWPADVSSVSLSISAADNESSVTLAYRSDEENAAADRAEETLAALPAALQRIESQYRKLLGEAHADKVTELAERWSSWLADAALSEDGDRAVLTVDAPVSALEFVTSAAQGVALQVGVQRVDRRTMLSANALRNLGIAMFNHHDALRQFPADIHSDDDKPLLSWRVAILPWIGEDLLFQEFHLDEPWDSPHNRELIKLMPRAFLSRDSHPEEMTTHFQLLRGPGSAAENGPVTVNQITDGAASTVALVEVQEAVEWTKPADFAFSPARPAAGLRSEGAHALMYDGEVVTIHEEVDGDILRSAFGSQDNQPYAVEKLIDPDWSAPSETRRLPTREISRNLRRLKGGSREDQLRVLAQLRRSPIDSLAQSVCDAVTPLTAAPDPYVRAAALMALLDWGDRADVDWPQLLPVLSDAYPSNRWLAAELLSQTRETTVAQAFIQMPPADWGLISPILYDNLPTVTADAAEAVLQDENPQRRLFAVHLLSAFGDDHHRQALVRMTKDDDDKRCREAAKDLLAAWPAVGPLRAEADALNGDERAAIRKLAREFKPDPDGRIQSASFSEDGERKYNGDLRNSDLQLLGGESALESLDLTSTRIGARGVAHLAGLKKLVNLELNYCAFIDDAAAVHIARLSTLESLTIDNTFIGDRGAEALAALPMLRALSIGDSYVTDDGLGRLAKMKSLRTLSISNTAVSDAGVETLAQHPQLTELYLADTAITDKGLESLATIESLRFLNIRNTRVSTSGIVKLRNALPQCEVVSE